MNLESSLSLLCVQIDWPVKSWRGIDPPSASRSRGRYFIRKSWQRGGPGGNGWRWAKRRLSLWWWWWRGLSLQLLFENCDITLHHIYHHHTNVLHYIVRDFVIWMWFWLCLSSLFFFSRMLRHFDSHCQLKKPSQKSVWIENHFFYYLTWPHHLKVDDKNLKIFFLLLHFVSSKETESP